MKKSGTTITNSEFEGSVSISELFSNFFSIGVVCNDAGAAEIISEILSKLRDSHDIKVHATGPAISIFRRNGFIALSVPLHLLILKSEVVLTGTGWQTDLESKSILLAKSALKPCYVVLDHWQNFRLRFRSLDGTFTFPNKILVTNLLAFQMAQKEIPEVKIILIPDLYIESLLKRHTLANKNENDSSDHVLYLSDGQPYSIASIYSQTKQIQKIADLKKEIESFGQVSLNELWIRPHPSDDTNDNPFSKVGEISIAIRKGELLNQLINAPLIIGTDSMAMYVAMRLGKRVLTLINDSDLPEWLDFCPTITHMNGTMINNPLLGTLLFDEMNQFYLRDFSILDIDVLHLQSTDANVFIEGTSDRLGAFSFDVQSHNLNKFRTQGNHCLAIINSQHQRIGLVTLRFEGPDKAIKASLIFYSEGDRTTLGSRIWEKMIEFLMQHFSHLQHSSNILATQKSIQGIFSSKI